MFGLDLTRVRSQARSRQTVRGVPRLQGGLLIQTYYQLHIAYLIVDNGDERIPRVTAVHWSQPGAVEGGVVHAAAVQQRREPILHVHHPTFTFQTHYA